MEELLVLTEKEIYEMIRYLGKVKYARTLISLLCKSAYYGIADSSIDKTSTGRALHKELRGNWRFLVSSLLPFSRKILTTMVAMNCQLTEWSIHFAKKIKEGI